MAYSALIQFIVFGLIIILAKSYFTNTQINTFSKNLIITDTYTTDEIGKYVLLKNKYALDLVLYNLQIERKLDSIKYSALFPAVGSKFGNCKPGSSDYPLICKTPQGRFAGITAIKNEHNVFGYVLAEKQYSPFLLLSASYVLLCILMVVVGIFLFNFLFLFLSMRKTISNNTGYLLDFISTHQKDSFLDISKVEIEEYRLIANKFVDEHCEITRLQKEKAYYDVRKNIAEQVAHDIRSPLAAISTALSDVSSIPEGKRILIRNAAKRINDIANNLLLQSKCTSVDITNVHTNKNTFPELIFTILDNIVSEKRYEYYQTNVDISLKGAIDSHCCFSEINLALFNRVLSNLINNSIEAVNEKGSILLLLESSSDQIQITLEDNGSGIPAEILPKVMEQGFSFNKKNGVGLGLAFAKQYIEQINGKVDIQSEMGAGTKITISLIRTGTPEWFCESIEVRSGSIIIVLDDDPSIHDAWRERFSSIKNIGLVHVSSIAELNAYHLYAGQAQLYLVDYELLADDKSGLDVIDGLNLNNRSLLVTSCFDDIDLRIKCAEIGVKIIPKSYVPYIQIIENTEMMSQSKIILIDDDELMRSAWHIAAEEAGEDLLSFPSYSEFIAMADSFAKNTHIYIDSDLGTAIRGEVCAKHLNDMGFIEIHLATGYEMDAADMPWIKSIVGKEPPFMKSQCEI